MNKIQKERSSGILLHITSLPNEYGIGSFGTEAFRFVDFLEAAGQKNWQILPMGMTGYGASPYQCFSAFAGSPYLISIEELIKDKTLTRKEIKKYKLLTTPLKVDYDLIYKNKLKLLRISYEKGKKNKQQDLEKFYKKNKSTLRDFCLYMSLRGFFDNRSHVEWPKEYQSNNSIAVKKFEKKHQDEFYFWVYTQYLFKNQWQAIKKYANKKNIKIIGDMPIYVSRDSSDVWANPSLFKLDKDGRPQYIAGCPPDTFATEGQLWGNPIYDWKAMELDGYSWWIDRIKHSFTEIDTLRIDHFRGFESFWQVKNGSPNAVKGRWVKGPGYKLFKKIQDELGQLDIIAEDLGFLTEKVNRLIERTGYPGMKILQFAFSSEEESDYLPHHVNKNSVIYTGTHDNDTLKSWLKHLPKKDLAFAVKYMKLNRQEGYEYGVIRTAWSSVSDLAIVPLQDFLCLDEKSRMNTPATVGNNWEWRVDESRLTKELATRIFKLTKLYGR